MSDRYDPTAVLAGLKDFQRATVDYVFQRMYEDPEPAIRFLVADEVGLGKTMVARGVIAKAVRHLQEQHVERIDVVYVCSNANIAAQNIRRLALPGFESFERATRLTLLPLELGDLSRNKLNFVAFTPGTSFNLRSAMGITRERALLHVLLGKLWGSRVVTTNGAYRVLGGWAQVNSLKWHIARVRERHLDRELAAQFATAVDQADREAHRGGKPSFKDRFVELSARFRYKRAHRPSEDWNDRTALVGELRQVLARTCIDALEPDLVILDEFQRFRNLLDGADPASELAQEIFAYPQVRTLLLSATPYKMYSLNDEYEDDHYQDFIRTARFLMGDSVDEFALDLDDFRRALFDIATTDGRTRALAAKERIETRLRSVMVRTERLALATNRNGMLTERPAPNLRMEPQDLAAFLATQQIAETVGAGNVTEYWKSAPYLLNFMDGYQLVKRLDALTDRRLAATRTVDAVLADGAGLISWNDFERYKRIDPQNARLRSLLAQTVDRGAWRLLWIPPSMPYYTPGTPFSDPEVASFTKRLVFSAWNVVPKAVASLASYEAERRMMLSGPRSYANTPEARKQIKPLLQFKKSRGRLSGLSTLPLIYPSPTLAKLGDPLRLAADLGDGKSPPPHTRVKREIERRVAALLAPHTAGRPTDGQVDKRWYWAAPLLLDGAAGLTKTWLDQPDIAGAWVGDGDGSDGDRERTVFSDALDYACAVVRGDLTDHAGDPIKTLGRVPDDLAAVLADVAIAAPGVAALRAFSRAGGEGSIEDISVRNAAASVAWGFRALFNSPEVTAMIGGLYGKHAYWREALRYCRNGNLQAVLDEYVHVLHDWLGILDGDYADTVRKIADELRRAVTLRTVGYWAEDRLNGTIYRFRSRFALRFGDEQSQDAKELQRASSVRAAFNSPFWPFILTTTSIGQEGLDFHLYCHAVVHWNLPANPVDLEQREGRVHRYKGHAVRKNLAATYRQVAIQSAGSDPWQAAFSAGATERAPNENDLVPFWLFPGEATIDRYAPNLPLSREVARLDILKKSLALYRLVFGQPRQEDLVEYLLSRGLPENEIAKLVDELRVDLQPQQQDATTKRKHTDSDPAAMRRASEGKS